MAELAKPGVHIHPGNLVQPIATVDKKSQAVYEATDDTDISC